MSAELLREAATKMRERAESATDTPHWAVHHDEPDTVVGYLVGRIATTESVDAEADAEHIAAWHPAVALAVADWLDAEAVHADEAEYLAARAQNEALTGITPAYRPSTHQALAVARAYLGRPE